MRDAKAALAEVRAVQAELNGTADKWRAAMNEELADLEKHVNQETDQVQEALDRNGKEIQGKIAELLGQADPATLLQVIIESLLADIKPATVKAVTGKIEASLPNYVMDALVDMAERGLDGRLSSKASRVLATAMHGATGRYPNGHSGTQEAVHGRQDHQS